ncbi:hypothetical protein PMI16_02139 [Herbaspirillum sp. CF444]|uniref:hypothetical protein n=1 Tax=Herbaspirillum sp. CF444 TaxID=1144319 RepID=UPI00027268CE|nr:hypothetical protein [Herbaspirillum sp. CF444]EJL88991.1 hypothetical protein PMI16_02139 [Herbaspirillum sp. CF444]
MTTDQIKNPLKSMTRRLAERAAQAVAPMKFGFSVGDALRRDLLDGRFRLPAQAGQDEHVHVKFMR